MMASVEMETDTREEAAKVEAAAATDEIATMTEETTTEGNIDDAREVAVAQGRRETDATVEARTEATIEVAIVEIDETIAAVTVIVVIADIVIETTATTEMAPRTTGINYIS